MTDKRQAVFAVLPGMEIIARRDLWAELPIELPRKLTVRRAVELLMPLNGERLNTALAGRLLGVSRTTASAVVHSLQQRGIVILLPFLGGGRKPLFYLSSRLGTEPARFRAFCIEAIMRAFPWCGFFWWMTGRVRQVDLVMQVGARRIGFCFSEYGMVRAGHWLPLSIATRRRVVHSSFLLYTGDHASLHGGCVQVLPLGAFLKEPEAWLFERQALREARDARNRINELAWRASRRRIS